MPYSCLASAALVGCLCVGDAQDLVVQGQTRGRLGVSTGAAVQDSFTSAGLIARRRLHFPLYGPGWVLGSCVGDA